MLPETCPLCKEPTMGAPHDLRDMDMRTVFRFLSASIAESDSRVPIITPIVVVSPEDPHFSVDIDGTRYLWGCARCVDARVNRE